MELEQKVSKCTGNIKKLRELVLTIMAMTVYAFIVHFYCFKGTFIGNFWLPGAFAVVLSKYKVDATIKRMNLKINSAI